MCTHMHKHIHAHTGTSTDAQPCAHIRAQTHAHTCITHTYTSTHGETKHLHMPEYIHMYRHIHIHANRSAHMHTHTHTHTHTLQFLAFMALFMLSPLPGMPCPHCGLANPTHTSRLISEATFFRKAFFGLDFPLCFCSYPELISIMLCCAVLCCAQ